MFKSVDGGESVTINYIHKEITETRKTLVRIEMICDICKKTVNNDDNWLRGSYSFAKTTIELSEGSRYPSGGDEDKTSYHICDQCFREKLIPWFAAQNIQPTLENTDW